MASCPRPDCDQHRPLGSEILALGAGLDGLNPSLGSVCEDAPMESALGIRDRLCRTLSRGGIRAAIPRGGLAVVVLPSARAPLSSVPVRLGLALILASPDHWLSALPPGRVCHRAGPSALSRRMPCRVTLDRALRTNRYVVSSAVTERLDWVRPELGWIERDLGVEDPRGTRPSKCGRWRLFRSISAS